MNMPSEISETSLLDVIADGINACQGKCALLLVSLNNLQAISASSSLTTRQDVIDIFVANCQSILRPNDALIVAGEDRLILVLDNLIDINHVKLAGMKLARVFTSPIELDLQTIKLEVFSGIVYLARQISSVQEIDHIYDKAEVALQTAIKFDDAQQAGENFHFHIATPDDGTNMDEHWQISQNLRAAIADHNISMDYQPKVDLKTGAIVGAEALVRWRHNGEVLPPLSYLPALQSDLMWELTQYCFRLILRDTNDYGLNLPISLNLDPSCLSESDLLPFLNRETSFWGIDKELITLEITDAKEIFNHGMIRENILGVRSLGFKISIDDFGSGHAGLQRLRDLPADEVKIHGTFSGALSSNPENEIITKSIIELAQSLGIKSVGQSIEDAETLNRLADWGCDLGQGFYLGAPVPIDQISTFAIEKETGS